MSRAPRKPLTLRQLAARLNDQHMRYSAGFYSQIGNRRHFKARVRAGVLEIYDWQKWDAVPAGTTFHDHNGRDFLTVPALQANSEPVTLDYQATFHADGSATDSKFGGVL